MMTKKQLDKHMRTIRKGINYRSEDDIYCFDCNKIMTYREWYVESKCIWRHKTYSGDLSSLYNLFKFILNYNRTRKVHKKTKNLPKGFSMDIQDDFILMEEVKRQKSQESKW